MDMPNQDRQAKPRNPCQWSSTIASRRYSIPSPQGYDFLTTSDSTILCKSIILSNGDKVKRGHVVLIEGVNQSGRWFGEVEELYACTWYKSAIGALIQPLELGSVVLPYWLPAIVQSSDQAPQLVSFSVHTIRSLFVNCLTLAALDFAMHCSDIPQLCSQLMCCDPYKDRHAGVAESHSEDV